MAIIAVTIILNLVMYFVLPDKMVTRITFDGSASNYMRTPLYLMVSAAIIGLSAGMGVFFADKKTKYFIITCILFAANIAALAVNLP